MHYSSSPCITLHIKSTCRFVIMPVLQVFVIDAYKCKSCCNLTMSLVVCDLVLRLLVDNMFGK